MTGGRCREIAALAVHVLAVVSVLFWAGLAAAQDGFDFDGWEKSATRAEGIIKDAKASSPALETLRESLTVYRSGALALQDQGEERIKTVTAQIEALGPLPTDGADETPELAARRAELAVQLAAATGPKLIAQEAYQRANGLIGEIDGIIRARQSRELFRLGPSPLNPAHWPSAGQAVRHFTAGVSGEVQDVWQSDAQRALMRRNAAKIIGLVVLGLILMTRAQGLLLQGLGLVQNRLGSSASQARALVVSMGRILLPLLGVMAIVQAAAISGVVGIRGAVVLEALPWMAAAVLVGRWLGRTLFNFDAARPLFLMLPPGDMHIGQRTVGLMGWVIALEMLLAGMAAQADFSAVAFVVLSFPLIVGGALLLFRMGRLLDPSARAETSDGPAPGPLRRQVRTVLARGALAVGVAAPLLAALGGFVAAQRLVYPAILTFALIGIFVVIYRILTDTGSALVRAAQEGEDDAQKGMGVLINVGLGFVLVSLSLPLLALIWGARASDLWEIWAQFNQGVSLGGRRISVTDFMTFAIVFAIGYTATRLLQGTLRTSVLPSTRLDAGGRNAILTGTGYVGIFLTSLVAISAAGLDLSSLAIVAGALSVGIGFGLQAIVSNFVSGIILLVERPIKEGDWIEVGAFSGYVRKISVRATEIQTFDRATVVVPNGDLITGVVTNWTHSTMNGRVKVPVGVAYGSDPREVEAILLDIATSHPRVLKSSPPSVVFHGFGADSLDFEIRAILNDVNYMLSAKSEMNHEIFRRFAEAGIEIPFAQRDVNLRNLGEVGATLKDALQNPEK